MTTCLLTTDEVRESSGSTDDLIEATTIQEFIDLSTRKWLSKFNITIEPKLSIDIQHNSMKRKIKASKKYLLKVLEIKLNDTVLDLDNIIFNMNSGLLDLNRISPTCLNTPRYSYKLKYLSAFMEKDINWVSETTSDIEIGKNVVVALEYIDIDYVKVKDWVMIEGMDGKRESAQIISLNIDEDTSTYEMTLDNLVQDHESGSIVNELKPHNAFKELVLWDVCTNIANYIIGNTSDLPTGFSLGPLSEQIGVAYTHWQKSSLEFSKKREDALKTCNTKLISIS